MQRREGKQTAIALDQKDELRHGGPVLSSISQARGYTKTKSKGRNGGADASCRGQARGLLY